MKFLAIAALFLVSHAQAGIRVISTGQQNYMEFPDGHVVLLGVTCPDFFTIRQSRGFADVAVYRNCGGNWAASETIGGSRELGMTCIDMRGHFSGEFALYQNCGINWVVDVEGTSRELGGGCVDFKVMSKSATEARYRNCGVFWHIDAQGNQLPL